MTEITFFCGRGAIADFLPALVFAWDVVDAFFSISSVRQRCAKTAKHRRDRARDQPPETWSPDFTIQEQCDGKNEPSSLRWDCAVFAAGVSPRPKAPRFACPETPTSGAFFF